MRSHLLNPTTPAKRDRIIPYSLLINQGNLVLVPPKVGGLALRVPKSLLILENHDTAGIASYPDFPSLGVVSNPNGSIININSL